MKLKYLPNFITTLRIIGAICLIFIAPLTNAFFVLYTLVGITDALDGFIARKTNSVTAFGSKLDSFADLLFYFVMAVKILPYLAQKVHPFFWTVVAIVLIIRITVYIYAYIKFQSFSSLHTYLGKLTGLLVFLTPYFYLTDVLNIFCIALSIVALIASLEDLAIYIKMKTYRINVKSIFEKNE